MLKSHDITFQYPGSRPMVFPDIDCGAGETCLLLGDSGSGKTTLLHLLSGLRRLQAGTVWIGDTRLDKLSGQVLDQFRGRQIGIVFQTAHFVRSLTVYDNLALAQRLAGLSVDAARIRELLDTLNVGHRQHAFPHQLSVGEQQRVAIARAIINRPSVILADEPTSALDDTHATRVVELLQRQAGDIGAALLIVTHDQRLTKTIDKQIRL